MKLDQLNCYYENEDCIPYQKEGDAGIDLRAKEKVVICEGVHKVETGFYVDLPEGVCGLLMPRSSSIKTGLKLSNTFGLIDDSFVGEITAQVCKDFQNYSVNPLVIEKGERFVQLVLMPYVVVNQFNFLSSLEELSDTNRGSSGFGDSGKF